MDLKKTLTPLKDVEMVKGGDEPQGGPILVHIKATDEPQGGPIILKLW